MAANVQRAREDLGKELREIFEHMDVDNSRDMQLAEFTTMVTSEPRATFLTSLDTDHRDPFELVELHEASNDGSIAADEVVDGVMRLNGESKSMDLQRLMVSVTVELLCW